ncbi:hypothetical protein Tco_1534584, partial [Tanacetum coccineum]
DYALWEVIENGNSWVPIPVTTPPETGTSTCKKNNVKARSLLLMALPNEHQLTFDQYVDAQSMFAAIKARFGGNEATNKTQKALLKQQYENFSASSTNNINTGNLEVSTATTKVNTASTKICIISFSDATVYAFLSTQPKGSQLVHEDLEQLHDDDLEEMDLKWNMTLLSMRARKFYQRTGRKIIIDGSNTAGYDKLKVECSSTKTVKIEDTSEKAMCVLALIGVTWQRKRFRQTWLSWHSQILSDIGFEATTYKRGLATLEGQIVKYKEHEVLFSEEIALLKRSIGCKEYELGFGSRAPTLLFMCQ